MTNPARSLALVALLAFAGFAAAEHCLPGDGTGCWPSQAEVKALVDSLSSEAEVYLPTGPNADMYMSYATDTPGNTLKPSSPGLIVFPMNEGDVRKVVTFAAKFRIRLVGKCSGHDQLQRSNGYGVIQLVTTKGFRNISYNETDHTITFGAGNAHKDVYAFLADRKRFAVGGTWAYVCPAGCLSNGCYGFFTKEFGSGADNVVGLRFMLFNGTTLNLDAAGPHRDLFWAILGGGASSYGVLLGITAKTYEAPDQFIIMKVFLSIWPTGLTKDQAPSVFTRFLTNLTWYQALPPHISWQLDNNPAEQRVLLQISYTGRTTVDVATEELSGLVAEWTEAGYFQEHGVEGYSDVADFAVKNSGAGPPIRRVSQSIYVDANQDALDKVAALWETLYSDAYMSPVGSDPFDGAFNFWAQYRYGPGSYAGKAPHVARGMRTAMMEIAHENVWMRQADDSFRAAISNDVKELMEPLGNTSYQNHCSTWAEYNVYVDYKTRFYQNWEGLTAVKKKYDPCNLYVVQYGPGWDLPKATCGLSTTSTKRPPPKRPPPRRHA
ncbi:hypothetical protein CHLRE_11g476600v5 [Chlamydomonas reinhardtii]|uniref:FAD-binding PCMH-type domain-containing protein n=1 Tax=Chlamydomonas reinhardtii TaxID=3055 RepID=A0A2K3D8D7_CHLRE|nr:uncharacterized protein CHLRE_11g476600v5 [Chlamydomonas reinhardtii]PNW76798.1 hypothetical protein CHLRE_11g476600v5 [Chlamydomonas reinhardtii]